MGITRAATTATTAVIHLTERLTTLDGRTIIGAIELTSIISNITTAIKAQVGVKKVAGLEQFQASLFLPEAEPSPVKSLMLSRGTDEVREAPYLIPQISRQRQRAPRTDEPHRESYRR
jgi:hypothetical protein